MAMRNIAYCLLLLCLAVGYKPAHAQKQIVDQANGWYMYFGNHKFHKHVGLHTEYQFRRSNVITDWQQSLLRVGIDYYIKPGYSVTAGYGWIETFPYGKQPIAAPFTEHRLWQQAILQHSIWRLFFHHRYRLEQRWLQNTTTNRYDFRNRFRYRGMVSIPFNKKTIEKATVYIALYNEVFLGFGKGIAKNVLDQNRFYAALGYCINGWLHLQAGYLNHYVIKADGIKAERNHTLQVSVINNFDFTTLYNKKKKPKKDG